MSTALRQRDLVWTWDPGQVPGWLARFAGQRIWWWGDAAPPGVEVISPRRARGRLGGECELLVFDARTGFAADAFGALIGSLVGGGALLLLTPPPGQWASGHFNARLVHLLQAAEHREPVGPVASPVFPAAADPAAATADQAQAVAALLRVAQGHRRRPLVLTADRGRGKSAALGIAAARLLQQGARRLVVTAARPAAVASLFDQLQRLLGTPSPEGLVFIAPDQLARQPQDAELVLVDEAAALPVPLLERLLQRHARIAFATTVHGYEGTGRGFAIRFRQILDQRTPGWRELHLAAPIRWPEGDPLEAFTFDALLLDAQPAPDAAVAAATPGQCTYAALSPAALAGNDALLRELFGLLVLAHYQTRPSDLQRLLDDPAVSVWAARHGGHLVAAVLLVAEGGLTPDLAEAVAAGRRRPAGHLLPQALVLHEGAAAGAALRYARVMRIAVHPAVQRRGIGQALLRAVLAGLRETDFLGTSFGASAELLAFWARAGLQPVRVGVQRDAASGSHSAMLLRPLTPAADAVFHGLRARFFEQFPYLLADGLQDLEPAVLQALAVGAPGPVPSARDADDLAAFAAGRRDYAGALGALWRGAWRALTAGQVAQLGAQPGAALLLRVLQKRPWAEVAALLEVPGRAQVEALLRRAAAALVTTLAGRDEAD